MFEKLINEHGSSVILKERLQLFSDKYEVLEGKNQVLEGKNSNLEAELQTAKEKIKELEAKIALTENSDTAENLSSEETLILKFLFDSNNRFQSDELARKFSIAIGKIEYHLNKLGDLNLIYCQYNMMHPTTYKISSDGQGYVVENGI